MSRSYKKFPVSRMPLWGNSMKKGKQIANRKIRRKLKDVNYEISDGHYYKFLGIDRWDLYEFKFIETKQDAIDNWWQHQDSNYTLKDALNDWEKFHKRK